MNTASKLFFENFAAIAASDGGIAKLRELILQLAVQGKLVPQDPKDEPAVKLFEKIKAERKILERAKKIRKEKEFPAVDLSEELFSLPQNWKWIRFADVGDWGAGATPNRSQSEYFGGNIPWFKSGELNGGILTESEENVTELALRNCSLRLDQPGDVLIAMYGATIGKVAILDVEATTNQAVCACTCFSQVSNKYLLLLLKAFKPHFIGNSAGAAQPNFSKIKIIQTPAPLPPLSEQKRIVAKVDELMVLCDQLERQLDQARQRHLQLNDSALHHLLAAENAKEFEKTWKLICQQFDLLYDSPENVDKLRQAILQLAVQGKLVPQDPTDEPAADLLKKIQSEKERLVKTGELRKETPLSSIDENESPFGLPTGWSWARLGVLTKKIGSGSTPRGGKEVYTQKGVKFLRSQNVYNEGLRLDSVVFISPEVHERMSGTAVYPGDVLLNITGASIARSCLIPDDFDEANVSQHVSIIRPVTANLRHYLHKVMISPYVYNLIMGVQVGISREGLSKSRLQYFPIPLPPLAEQKRIVTKVDKLMALCDQLEQNIRSTRLHTRQLTESIIHHLLAG